MELFVIYSMSIIGEVNQENACIIYYIFHNAFCSFYGWLNSIDGFFVVRS